MKKLLISLVGASLFVSTMAWAGEQDFTLVNNTGYQIDEVYVATLNSKTWGEDIMGDGVLSNGGSKEVHFKNSTSACKWQLAVKFEDGTEVEWDQAVDLCTVEKITLTYNRSKGVVHAALD